MTNQFTKINHQFLPVPANKVLDCYSCNPYVYSGKSGSDASDCGVYIFNTEKQQFIVLREFERIGRPQFLIDVPIGLANLIPHLLATLKDGKIEVSPNVAYLYLEPAARTKKSDQLKFVVVADGVDIEPQPFNPQQLVAYFKKQGIEVEEDLLTYA
ncbi:hypothetical protein RYA05_03105 [Pseudomonas syringae pv. actinidiae]|nr:hypothetical protein [Pseudomonas syringae pv. actinidiae]